MKENSQWLVQAQKADGKFETFKFAGILPQMLRFRATFIYDLMSKTERRVLHTNPDIKIVDFDIPTIPWVTMEWMQRNGFAPSILTKARAVERADYHNGHYEVYASLKDKAFFFVNDYCYGLYRVEGQLPDHWVPCSFNLPTRVVPREGVEDGWVSNIDTWISIFEMGSTLIETEDQLRTILKGSGNG